jgi:integrase
MLTAKKVERTKVPGRYRCGLVKGLYLQIGEGEAKSWVLRYELRGREHMMGLGSAADFSLKEARERARAARQLLADRINPLDGRRAQEEASRLAEAHKLSFGEAAQRYFDPHEKRWRNARSRDEFLSTLKAHAFGVLGDMDVASIDTRDVLRALEPIWKTKAVTADRVRSRVEQVIDWAIVRGHRPPGTNPARWKGHLSEVLPPPRKVAPIKHHAAMDYREVPAFMVELRKEQGSSARALEFLILVAARTGEVVGAQWSEIDFDSKTWIVPAQRMKGHREHRVPLSPACIELLRRLPRQDGNPFVFIGRRAGTGLNRMALRWVMDRLGQSGVAVTHGFRSSFSNFSHEQTAHSARTIEISLAHNVGTEVERAYRRTDMISKRRQLMEQWAKFCSPPPSKVGKAGGEVVSLRGGR